MFCRPEEFNTITPQLRDELDAALDAAERDPEVRVVLLAAEGRAFCAGFGLDWSTAAPTTDDRPPQRVWDTVIDVQMIGRFGNTFAKLHEISKPTIAAVQGWCIAGGTDMILNADLIIAGEAARFGYPPARVWGVPEAPWVWVARLGLERAKRYLFTGDELTATEAAGVGMILECVPDDDARRALDGVRATHRATAVEPAPDDEVDAQRRRAVTSTSPTPAGCSGSSSTASLDTRRRDSTSWRVRRRSVGVKPCANAIGRSAITESARPPELARRRPSRPAACAARCCHRAGAFHRRHPRGPARPHAIGPRRRDGAPRSMAEETGTAGRDAGPPLARLGKRVAANLRSSRMAANTNATWANSNARRGLRDAVRSSRTLHSSPTSMPRS